MYRTVFFSDLEPGFPSDLTSGPGAPAYVVRCLKEAGHHSVWLIKRPGQESRTFKTWPLTFPTALKLVFGGAQAQRQRRGALRLAALNIRTPEPLGRCALHRSGGTWLVALELRFVPGRSALDIVLSGKIDEELARASGRQLGRIVRTLAGAGFTHRDLKLNNVVIEETADGPVVWLVDTVGIQHAPSRLQGVMRMLERLFLFAAWRSVTRHRSVWVPILREALRGLSGAERREAFRLLHRDFRSYSSLHDRASGADRPRRAEAGSSKQV